MIEGVYLDGKTSKPNAVSIKLNLGNLEIRDKETNELLGNWHLSECETNSFNSSQTLQIAYGEFPKQSLEIASHTTEIRREMNKYKSLDSKIFDYSLNENSIKTILFGLFILGGLIWFYVAYVSVYVGNAIVEIIPVGIEEEIGERALNQYDLLLDIDSNKSHLLNEFFSETGLESEYDIQVYYDSSSVVNAFALPGGKIVIYRGIIEKMESWEELAALLSHELTHVNQRHTLKILSKQIGNYAVFSAITGDMVGISGVVVEQAINLSEMSYSRDFEQESDVLGLEMLIRNKIRPTAMLDLMERLKAENEDLEGIMEKIELLSSHPLTDNRIEYIKKSIEQNNVKDYSGDINHKAKEIWKKIRGETEL